MNRYGLLLASIFLIIIPFSSQAGIMLPGLTAPVTIVHDSNGIPHIYADNEHDLYFMQGRIHAEDRLFQMDLLRRSAAGTLAELFGPTALQTDVETRTIGLSRAAVRSLAEHSSHMLDILQAYSDGVNSYLGENHPLPPEYGALGLNSVKPWEPLDSVLVGKALAAATSLLVVDDIDLTVALQTYQGVGEFTGAFDGTALFFGDLFRSAPFDPAATVPDAINGYPKHPGKADINAIIDKLKLKRDGKVIDEGRNYLERIHRLPRIPGAMRFDGGNMGGSNSWVISGKHTPSGRPLLANDMHLKLENPAIFHEQHLTAPGINVTGSSLAGAPCIVRGHNDSIAWGFTNSRIDITDIYADVVVPAPGTPSGYATYHASGPEPIQLVIETFNANINGQLVPIADATTPVLIVPRRNNGPLITAPSSDPATGNLIALSVQSVGFGPTRDPEGLCALNRASNLEEFKAAIQLIDFASQNITYADTDGNVGYFVTGEVPLREDLLNPVAPITPPFLIRTGFTGNEWAALDGDRPDNQATPYAILPFNEMPQVVNPPSGVIVNANNDQLGNTLDNDPLNDLRQQGPGLRYLNWGGRNFSIRAGRITEMINDHLSKRGKHHWRPNKISFQQIKAMQADTVLNDAKALTPYILQAYADAGDSAAHPTLAAIAADPRVQEAVSRLAQWNFTTPTGIPEGYDADSSNDDVDASVAATIYAVWRGQMVANTIDATLDTYGLGNAPRPANREEVITALQHLLEQDGVGLSGLNFFNVAGDDASIRRDIIVLGSLASALDLLASDAFAPAFANSTDQDDYRWGKLHRVMFKHALGDVAPEFNVPPAFGFFPSPLGEQLSGIPIDGGFETVDEAPPLDANNIRVSDSESMTVEHGPTGRFVVRPGRWKVYAETSLAGGESAVPGSPFFLNLLVPYLRNETFPLLTAPYAVKWDAFSIEEYVP